MSTFARCGDNPIYRCRTNRCRDAASSQLRFSEGSLTLSLWFRYTFSRRRRVWYRNSGRSRFWNFVSASPLLLRSPARPFLPRPLPLPRSLHATPADTDTDSPSHSTNSTVCLLNPLSSSLACSSHPPLRRRSLVLSPLSPHRYHQPKHKPDLTRARFLQPARPPALPHEHLHTPSPSALSSGSLSLPSFIPTDGNCVCSALLSSTPTWPSSVSTSSPWLPPNRP